VSADGCGTPRDQNPEPPLRHSAAAVHGDARPPASLNEPLRGDRRLLIDYHERILATSTSPNRQLRSTRALERLQREQREEADRLTRIEAATPPRLTIDGQLQRWRDAKADDGELEPCWNGAIGRGGKSLTSVDAHGTTLTPGPGYRVNR
jgi:hypothetical protein